MRGYKGTDKDMRCRGFQFELGKTYRAQGEIKICRNGFHFCKNLGSVFEYYPPNDGNRFFEIEAREPVNRKFSKYVTAEISFIRELSAKEIGRALYGNGCDNRYEYGYGDYYGSGYSDGIGDGNGFGDGRGYGDTWGLGNGYGDSSSYGSGNCHGGGYGDGEGYSRSNGSGHGDGITKVNLHKILFFKEED